MTAIEFNSKMLKEQSGLKHFALSLTRNTDNAFDLLQDTLLKAMNYREKFDADTNLKAWLFTIMKNTFINNYRRQKKINALVSQGDEVQLNRAFSQNVYEHSQSRIQSKDILSKIESLDATYREPFVKYYIGYKYEDIAKQMNLPLGTVKSRIFIARKLLMEQLEEYRRN